MTVADWQFDLDGFTFGMGTEVGCADFTSDGDITHHDAHAPSADGTWFGRDTHPGVVYTLDLQVRRPVDPAAALDTLNELRAVWRGDAVRRTPGAVTHLVVKRPGRAAQRVYGRPRKCTPASYDTVASGVVEVVAEFASSDDVFYADDEQATPITIRPATVGGFPVPAPTPWGAGDAALPAQNQLEVGGSLPTWLCADVHGPVVSPVVEVVGHFVVSLPGVTVGANRVLTIDPRPWSRSVLTDEGDNRAGSFSADTPALFDMAVPPGSHVARLSGVDPTGTAWVNLRHRAANPGY